MPELYPISYTFTGVQHLKVEKQSQCLSFAPLPPDWLSKTHSFASLLSLFPFPADTWLLFCFPSHLFTQTGNFLRFCFSSSLLPSPETNNERVLVRKKDSVEKKEVVAHSTESSFNDSLFPTHTHTNITTTKHNHPTLPVLHVQNQDSANHVHAVQRLRLEEVSSW